MEEVLWTTLEEFPDYGIYNTGVVINVKKGREISQSESKVDGELRVNLRDASGIYRTMSVKKLVATTFVPGRTEIFNTPIQLDWDIKNNNAYNLAWRPRWFAHLYRMQRTWYDFDDDLGSVVEYPSGILYLSVMEASQANGILIRDIIRSVSTDQTVFPTGQVFRLARYYC